MKKPSKEITLPLLLTVTPINHLSSSFPRENGCLTFVTASCVQSSSWTVSNERMVEIFYLNLMKAPDHFYDIYNHWVIMQFNFIEAAHLLSGESVIKLHVIDTKVLRELNSPVARPGLFSLEAKINCDN